MAIEIGKILTATVKAVEKNSKTIVQKTAPKAAVAVSSAAKPVTYAANSYGGHLIKYCEDKNLVNAILKNNVYSNRYVKIVKQIREDFKNIPYSEDKEAVIVNLSAMLFRDSRSFKTLWDSKGMKEIIKGNLSISYLKNLKSSDKIDENFFYKLFESIENKTNERLFKAGIDLDAANGYIKAMDKEVCKNPQFIEGFVSSLEHINNPEIANSILRHFKFTPKFVEKENQYFLDFLKAAEENPQAAQKALMIKNSDAFILNKNTKLLADKVVTDENYNIFINLSKKYPQTIHPRYLQGINTFLKEGGNEKSLEQIIMLVKEGKIPKDILLILNSADKDNIKFLEKFLQEGKFDEKSWFKFRTLMDPIFKSQSEETLEELYKQVFIPWKEALKENVSCDEMNYIIDNLVSLKLSNPQKYKVLEDLNILSLIKEKKINPRILTGYNQSPIFTPEILADIEKLNKGESIIKKFTSMENILQKTQAGDVVSVNNKLYINNNGRLEPWQMTEEKFNELFPLVDRFSTIQGADDCYLITVLNSLYQNPKTRGDYYKMFKQKGDDIFVTIPAYSNFRGTRRFSNGKIKTVNANASAAKHIQMIERCYSRAALRKGSRIPVDENPLSTKNYDFLQKRISGGHATDVIKEFLPERIQQKRIFTKTVKDKNQIEYTIQNYANNPRYIINRSFSTSKNTGHATSIKSYNPETKTVTYTDPNFPAVVFEIPLDKVAENNCRLVLTQII